MSAFHAALTQCMVWTDGVEPSTGVISSALPSRRSTRPGGRGWTRTTDHPVMSGRLSTTELHVRKAPMGGDRTLTQGRVPIGWASPDLAPPVPDTGWLHLSGGPAGCRARVRMGCTLTLPTRRTVFWPMKKRPSRRFERLPSYPMHKGQSYI